MEGTLLHLYPSVSYSDMVRISLDSYHERNRTAWDSHENPAAIFSNIRKASRKHRVLVDLLHCGVSSMELQF